MNPATTVGRHPLSTRFTAIAHVVALNMPDKDQLMSVYSAFLGVRVISILCFYRLFLLFFFFFFFCFFLSRALSRSLSVSLCVSFSFDRALFVSALIFYVRLVSQTVISVGNAAKLDGKWKNPASVRALTASMLELFDQLRNKFSVDDYRHYSFNPRSSHFLVSSECAFLHEMFVCSFFVVVFFVCLFTFSFFSFSILLESLTPKQNRVCGRGKC